MLYMFAKSLMSGEKAPPNPWGSAGYEWMTATPAGRAQLCATAGDDPRAHTTITLRRSEELDDGFPEPSPSGNA